MNRKIVVICILLVNIVFIKSEDNLLTQTSDENHNQTVPSAGESTKTNDTNRNPKDLGQIITAAIAGAMNAASAAVVNEVVGNQLVTTSELCLGRRDRYCDEFCHEEFRGPMDGYCRSGICVCECDQYECNRYCRRDWDDDDFYPRSRYPLTRTRGRNRGYCTYQGCQCD